MGSRSARHSRNRRDRRDYCKKNRGPHTPAVVFRGLGTGKCHEASWWWPNLGWWCWHQEECTGCGQIMRRNISDTECPDWATRDTTVTAERGMADDPLIAYQGIPWLSPGNSEGPRRGRRRRQPPESPAGTGHSSTEVS